MPPQSRIAIIDTGINSNIVDVEQRLFVNGTGICEVCESGITSQNFSHGTQCALIIKKFYPESSLVSIEILNYDNTGSVEKLQPALEWCFQNQVYVVNLSLGTTNFGDRSAMLPMVNDYANKGMIIIAATSNSGYLTYPASFSNVIGIGSRDVMGQKHFDRINLGIDVKASAAHTLNIGEEVITTPQSNSFAAPYITALLAKKKEQKNLRWVSEMKHELYQNMEYHSFPQASGIAPDWITTGYPVNIRKKSSANYYFKVAELKKADTIIVETKEQLEKYKKYQRHMVYLGGEPVRNPNNQRFFWSRQNRIRQIEESPSAKKELEIPIVIWENSINKDEIDLLKIFREEFREEGYNVYAVSTQNDAILYDIEYIPEEMLNQREKIYNFLYWQLYVKQSDLIFFVIDDFKKLQGIFEEIDIIIKMKRKVSKTWVTIECSEEQGSTMQYKEYGKEAILDIYLRMKSYLTEEECE